MTTALSATSLACGYRRRQVLHGLNVSLEEGEVLGVVGPNGSGKTTVLRAVTGVLPLADGKVTLWGRDLSELSRRDIAREVAVVPQFATTLFPFTVREVAAMGRIPYLGRLSSTTPRDRAAVEQAMDATGVSDLAERPFDALSGGERQRTIIARALAQEPRILMLDEPTTFLDIVHQADILELVLGLARERGLAVLFISHDLNVASQYCQRLLLLHVGRLFAEGTPEQVITSDNLTQVYGGPVHVSQNPWTGKPWVNALPKRDAGDADALAQ